MTVDGVPFGACHVIHKNFLCGFCEKWQPIDHCISCLITMPIYNGKIRVMPINICGAIEMFWMLDLMCKGALISLVYHVFLQNCIWSDRSSTFMWLRENFDWFRGLNLACITFLFFLVCPIIPRIYLCGFCEKSTTGHVKHLLPCRVFYAVVTTSSMFEACLCGELVMVLIQVFGFPIVVSNLFSASLSILSRFKIWTQVTIVILKTRW